MFKLKHVWSSTGLQWEALHWDTRKGLYFTIWRSSCSLSKYGNLNHCSLGATLHFVTQERMNKLHPLCIPGLGITAFAGVKMHFLFTLSGKNMFCEIYASNSTLFTILWKLPCFINVRVFFSSIRKMLLDFELPVSKEGSQLKTRDSWSIFHTCIMMLFQCPGMNNIK